MSKLLIGCDPECFWESDKGMMSVIGKLGGSKEMCFSISENIHVLEDNVAAEFNPPPSDNLPDFMNKIHENLEYLESAAKKYGATLSRLASASFQDSELENPMAFVFGCEPDFNAWTGEQNPPPINEDYSLRSCGGHVHIGHGRSSVNIIRAMDLFLGVPSVILDKDEKRRSLYGKAGAYRPKPYGDEYRTLSNFWIFNDSLIEWVFNRTKMAVDWAKNNVIESDSTLAKAIQDAINSNNKDTVKSVFEMVPMAGV